MVWLSWRWSFFSRISALGMITMVYWLWFICCVNSGGHYQTCVSRLLSAVSYCTSSSIHQFNCRIVADVINFSFQLSNYSRFFYFFIFFSWSIFGFMNIKRWRWKESLVFMKFKAKTALTGQSPPPHPPTPPHPNKGGIPDCSLEMMVKHHCVRFHQWCSTVSLLKYYPVNGEQIEM